MVNGSPFDGIRAGDQGPFDRKSQITNAYQTYLGRTPGENEYSSWMGNDDFQNGIKNSPEAQTYAKNNPSPYPSGPWRDFPPYTGTSPDIPVLRPTPSTTPGDPGMPPWKPSPGQSPSFPGGVYNDWPTHPSGTGPQFPGGGFPGPFGGGVLGELLKRMMQEQPLPASAGPPPDDWGPYSGGFDPTTNQWVKNTSPVGFAPSGSGGFASAFGGAPAAAGGGLFGTLFNRMK